jgi:hypothetical protein
MKIKLLFLLLPLFGVTFAGCSDDEDANVPAPDYTGDIFVRLVNATGQTLEDNALRFNFGNNGDQEYRFYGTLTDSLPTEYLPFEEAGSCSIDFTTRVSGAAEPETFMSLCLCVCALSEGNYTARITDATPSEEELRPSVDIEQD